MINPTDIKAAYIISKLPLYEVYLIKITFLIKAIIKFIYNKLIKIMTLTPYSNNHTHHNLLLVTVHIAFLAPIPV